MKNRKALPKPTSESFEHWRARMLKDYPGAKVEKWRGARGLTSANLFVGGVVVARWHVGDPMPKRTYGASSTPTTPA